MLLSEEQLILLGVALARLDNLMSMLQAERLPIKFTEGVRYYTLGILTLER